MRPALLRDRGGFIIMGVVFAMMMFVLMAITGVAMLTNQSQTSLNVMRLAQANAIRLGALEYIQKRLQYDLDWSTLNTATETVRLDNQNTTITYTNTDLDPNRVDVASSTDAVLDVNRMARRNQRFTVYRLPQASHYSFFRGNRGGSTASVALTGTIKDHAYLNESVTGGAFTDSYLYYTGPAPTSTISASSSAVSVTDPAPGTPSFDWGADGNAYDNRIAQYDAQIKAVVDDPAPKNDIAITVNGTYDQAALELLENPNDGDGVVEAANFYIDTIGDVIFTGAIKIVAHGDIRLQANVPGACRVEGTTYKTSDGGCKKIGTNSIWSGVQADEGAVTGMDQATAAAACGNLGEGGFPAGNWRLPTDAELAAAAADVTINGPFTFEDDQRFWSSTAAAAGTHKAVNLHDEVTTDEPDGDTLAVVCVRENVDNAIQGTLELQPAGAGIEFVAGRSLVRGDDKRRIFNDPDTAAPTYFYSRNRDSLTNASGGQMYITESTYLNVTTTPRGLHNGYAMANRRLFTGPRSVFTRFLLYVPRVMPDPLDLTWTARISNTEGLLTVAGSDRTAGGIATVSGAILSLSETGPNMSLQNSATEGLVYSYGTDANGRLQLQDASHDGSMIANDLQANQMDVNGDLTHTMLNVGGSIVFSTDHTRMPESRMIDGFTGGVSVRESSWDGS